MSISRRGFMGLSFSCAGALAAGGLIPLGARASSPRFAFDGDKFFEWKKVSEKVYAGFGAGGNTAVIIGKSGLIVVDAKNAPYGAQLRREAESYGGAIKHLVNTHHHADHTGGNHAFIKDIMGVAHANCPSRVSSQVSRYLSQVKEGVKELAEKKGPAADAVVKDNTDLHARWSKLTASDFAPQTTFTDSMDLDIGGPAIKLRHFGPGHTDNDIIVHIPDENVIHMGDLLFNRVYPYIDGDGGGSTLGWQGVLREVVRLCDDKTRIIPGHGELCGKPAIEEQIRYFDDMRAWVAKQMKDGRTRKEIVESNPPPYENYNVPWIRPITLGGIYDELKKADAK